MKRINKKIYIYFGIFLVFVLSACSSDPDFDLYKGRSLTIAVIGKPPQVREEQIKFKQISFNQLTTDEMQLYDAVFIAKEHLYQASESKYVDIYLNSSIPFFFLSSNSHIPFTLKNERYDKKWDWTPGKSYAVGFIAQRGSQSLKYWGFGLYNDKKTDRNLRQLYSTIFEVIEGQNLEY